jgi:hypothetical protein
MVSLVAKLTQDEDCVVTAKAKGVADGYFNGYFPGFVGHVIEVAFWIGCFIVDRRRYYIVVN